MLPVRSARYLIRVEHFSGSSSSYSSFAFSESGSPSNFLRFTLHSELSASVDDFFSASLNMRTWTGLSSAMS